MRNDLRGRDLPEREPAMGRLAHRTPILPSVEDVGGGEHEKDGMAKSSVSYGVYLIPKGDVTP